MKPFLGIDLTLNKKNEKSNGEEFLIKKPSSSMTESLDTSVENTVNMIEQSKLPLAIRICHWICGAVGVLVAVGILRALTDEDSVSLAEAYKNAAWLFWLAGICLIAWLILHIFSRKKEKDVFETDESDRLISTLGSIADSIYAELGVPSDAKSVDVLSFNYKSKDSVPKAYEKMSDLTPYKNFEYSVFADTENLYLANLDGKYRFPMSSMRVIRTVKKSISVPDWNKEIEPGKGEYKQYKLNIDNNGCIHFKPYHILEFEYAGEVWGIYFPNYELSVFEELTGLKAE